MNLVAVTAFSVGVRVLAFILMSNHVHFVLEGEEENVIQFITEFKRAFSRYLAHKYACRDTLRRNGTDIQNLPLDGESLERAIAYVQMNSVAANICTRPEAYVNVRFVESLFRTPKRMNYFLLMFISP